MIDAPLTGRDAAIVQTVSRFKQASAKQLRTILFPTTASPTPSDRALKRLCRDQYLLRIERRTVGGNKGGSGVYVYALGRRGFYAHFTGRYVPARTVNYHALAIVDAYIALRGLEEVGALNIKGLSTEPDCWLTIGSVDLRPDLYVELQRADETAKIMCEIDMGSEGQRHLRAKLDAYWRAYNHIGAGIDPESDPSTWPQFPGIWWLCVDEERVKEIRWLVSTGSPEAAALFRVGLVSELGAMLA